MFRIASVVAVSLGFSASAVFAQTSHDAQIDTLFEALGLPAIVDVMREEGVSYGDTLAEDMLPNGADARWAAVVEQVYDTQAMSEELIGAMGEALAGDDVAAILDFYTSDLGTKIVGLEVSARRALLDPAIEEASKEAAALLREDEDPRVALATELIETNDLIEANVVGGLNSSYAFYMGLIDGGGMPTTLTPESALQDVWSQEPTVREDTIEWVYTFVLLAYQPLSDEELGELIAFSKSSAGQDLTTALFAAFDSLFVDVSRGLGLGLSRSLSMQEL
jgi:hypothetical protein